MYGFEPIEIIETEVFATLPEEFHSSGKAFRGPTRLNKTGTTFEGPSFDRDGNLYFVDVFNSRIFRVSPDKKFELICEYDGEPNGLKIHKDGRIFVTDHRHGLMLLDPAAGTISIHMLGSEKERFKGLNDLVFASNGDLYFTDQGGTGLHDPTGRVYRLSAGGELRAMVSTVPGPNGILMNEAETMLYVVARTNSIWQFPLTERGGVVKGGEFARLPCPGPDGLAADVNGNVFCASPGLGVVWGWTRQGVPRYRLNSCAGHHLTNLAFGGPDNRWMYITEGDSFSILRARMPYAGRPMFSHM